MSDFIVVNNFGPRTVQYEHIKIASLKEIVI